MSLEGGGPLALAGARRRAASSERVGSFNSESRA